MIYKFVTQIKVVQFFKMICKSHHQKHNIFVGFACCWMIRETQGDTKFQPNLRLGIHNGYAIIHSILGGLPLGVLPRIHLVSSPCTDFGPKWLRQKRNVSHRVHNAWHLIAYYSVRDSALILRFGAHNITFLQETWSTAISWELGLHPSASSGI